jgi:L-aspartate oxidase
MSFGSQTKVTFDYVDVVSVSAGLTFALTTAEQGASVAMVTKKSRTDSNTNWAQGGIAGVFAEDDNPELHIEDTLIAGAGLCNEEAVRILVKEGPERIKELEEMGARFSHESDGKLSLGREGGHSRRRIVHAADLTGKEVERSLVEASRTHKNISIFEDHCAIDLIAHNGRCYGVQVLNDKLKQVELFLGSATLLSTGGCGQVYRHTTNPPIATGDGVAIAWRAGCPISNMEFIQFHPTSLYHPDARNFLISEAVRGEGGVLRRKNGEAFMLEYDQRGDLAPRDIVARAIDMEMKKGSFECVYLDITHKSESFIKEHFPTIYSRCLSYGIDMTTEWLPVVPAAHYSCGGVKTDLYGRTSLEGLFACGEVACTGVQGANRLASNSLLEALVFSRRAADVALKTYAPGRSAALSSDVVLQKLRKVTIGNGETLAEEEHLRERLQIVMSKYVGIVRSNSRLAKAKAGIEAISDELFSANLAQSTEVLELENMLTVAELIVRSAESRHESRGLHFTKDYPELVESEKHDTVLVG